MVMQSLSGHRAFHRPHSQLRNAAAGAGSAGVVSQPAAEPAAWAAAVRAELCATMWRHCGIVRQREGLKVRNMVLCYVL